MRIGTAGWSIPRQCAAAFPTEGTHLERYARQLSCVEINSSFHRPHRPATYARWAASVPAGFRFAVKLPRELSHRRKLLEPAEPLDRFLAEIAALGERLGPVLVQLPPSLAFDAAVAVAFFRAMRARFAGDIVCEPRHATWFGEAADAMLMAFRVARVAADPVPAGGTASPGGWPEIVYRRLHGSPRMYYSAYAPDTLDLMARAMREAAGSARENWCIFDNTTLGHATEDALGLVRRLERSV